MRCNKRQATFWHAALAAKPASTPHEAEPEINVSWSRFTSGNAPVLRIKKDKGDG